MKGIAAVFLVAVISMITGCAALHPQPAAPTEPDPWADFHNGREVAPAPVAKAETSAPAAPSADKAKDATPANGGDAVVTDKTAMADTAEAPAPKPSKKKKGKHGKAGATPTAGAHDAALAKKKPRKRTPKPVPASDDGN